MNNKCPAACAIISGNYLSDARVLASSYLKYHPGANFYVLVVDGLPANVDIHPPVHVIHLDELNIPYMRELCFKYSATELCCALKPTLLHLLLTEYHEEQVIYFDSDILVMRRLDAVMERLNSVDIVLTPHLLDPLPLDGLRPNEQDILIAGAHNLGFIAVRKSSSTARFLHWWEGRLRDGGFIEFSQGLLTDQRWVDLVPSLFSSTLLKDETYNVAYWNIPSRAITNDHGVFLVNGQAPLSFFHFSGFDPNQPTVLSKHQTRTRIEQGSGLGDLLQYYVDLQIQNGFKISRKWKYGFAGFDNGTNISSPIRRVYSGLDESYRAVFGDPFHTSGDSFFNWATRDDALSHGLSPFLRSLYEIRTDLTIAFPDVNGKDREAFLEWAWTHGASEYKYDPAEMGVKRGVAIAARGAAPQSLKCSIIIPVYNNAALTHNCLNAVLGNLAAQDGVETIVVNDGSTDDTADVLNAFSGRIEMVVHETNKGFADSCNDGAAIAQGDYLIFLNNDTAPQEGWLDALLTYADAHPEAAVVGSKLLFPNDTVQHAGIVICEDREPRHIYAGFPADDPHVNRSRRYQAVTGACMLIRRNDFLRAGGFDNAFRNGYEDIDLCLRLGATGRQVHYCHESVLHHFESATRTSSKNQDGLRNAQLYRQRWSDRVHPDEFDFYFQDEMIKVDYRSLYPATFSISPLIGAINVADRQCAADRLIQARANQVIGLLKDNIRLQVNARATELRLKLLSISGRPNEADPAERTDNRHHNPKVLHRGQSLWLSERTTNRLISVILPVKNGAPKLRQLLPALLSQQINDLVEIIAVDSASTDDSVEVLKQADATVIAIDPGAFDHGLTRNLATQYARGEIYVFMNQSTMPADEHWLSNLIRPLLHSGVAGVCGRILPRSDADWLNAKDIKYNINASSERVVTKITDREAYLSLNPENLRRFVNFHSLSTAIRADVFKKIPFREVNFAEDLIWGKEVLEAGFSIQYEPSAVALHSHNYSILDVFRRNFDDGAACQKICGRTLNESDIAASIMHEVRDDWRYLKEECHLQGDELDQWKTISVLRRSAQTFGHWIGVQYERAEKTPDGLASIFSITRQIKAGAKTEQPEEFIANARFAG